MGKPVYLKLIDGGDVAANTWKQVSGIAENVDVVLSYSGAATEGTYSNRVILPSEADGLMLRAGAMVTSGGILYVSFKCDQRTLTDVNFLLKYTKTEEET